MGTNTSIDTPPLAKTNLQINTIKLKLLFILERMKNTTTTFLSKYDKYHRFSFFLNDSSQVKIGNDILGDFEQWMHAHPVRCWPFCCLLKILDKLDVVHKWRLVLTFFPSFLFLYSPLLVCLSLGHLSLRYVERFLYFPILPSNSTSRADHWTLTPGETHRRCLVALARKTCYSPRTIQRRKTPL